MPLYLPRRLLSVFCFLTLVFCLLPSPVLAQLKINEVSPWSEPDWVEIVNTATEAAELDNYLLRDSTASNKKILTGEIPGNGYLKVDFSNYLNKDGDTVRLLVNDNGMETEKDRMEYDKQLVCPEQTAQSIGRLPDLTGSFQMLTAGTPGESNVAAAVVSCQLPTPTVKPTSTPKPTNTPKPQVTATNSVSQVNIPALTSVNKNIQAVNITGAGSGNKVEPEVFEMSTITDESTRGATLSGWGMEDQAGADSMVLGTVTNGMSGFSLPVGLAVVGIVTGIGSLAATAVALRNAKTVK